MFLVGRHPSLNVVYTGDIVDRRFTPSNPAAVSAFFERLENDTEGELVLSDNPYLQPMP